MITIDLLGFSYIVPSDLESAVRRGDADAVAQAEDFIASAQGDPREMAWLIDTYHQLGVPEPFRRVSEEMLKARTAARWRGTVEMAGVQIAARAARQRHLACVRWNAEHGLVNGWRVMDGDPEPEPRWRT